MRYFVGDFLDPKKETDIEFEDFDEAKIKFAELSVEKVNFIVGFWSDGNDYAEQIAINGEIFNPA
ncbi:MAG: hypothetical protein KAI70_01210 [Candidatus Omnitrophica bacterium]|nr:hypothetical protein [Candidatus Omnitrophota bacterium]